METTYRVTYHKTVVAYDIPMLSRVAALRVMDAIQEKLRTQPDLFGKPLRRSLAGYRSLRVGDYRIVFQIEKRIVKIFVIAHREHVYEMVLSRIK